MSVSSREEVEAFLAETQFSGYQRFPLPHGLEIPGVDRKERADQVFSMDLAGKSVLDVGTKYGVFAYEAITRGAERAVGLEPAYLGDASATATVDALLPLWFGLVKQNGGNRRVALRMVTDR